MNARLYQDIKDYLKLHWVALLLGAIPPTLVALVSLINIFIAFRIDYSELKLTVQANNNQVQSLETQLQLNQNEENANINKLLQEGKDTQNQLNQVSNELNIINGRLINFPGGS